MKRILIVLLLLISLNALYFAQNKARIMTYNILNYTDYNNDNRNIYYKKIIEAAKPDILVLQEIKTANSVSQFLSKVLSSKYKAGTFIPNQAINETNNAIFYKDSLFTFIANYPVMITADPGTTERDISEFKLVHNFSKDTIIIYSAHLKSGPGTTNEQRRLKEVTTLRARTATLSDKSYYIIVGDFNLYSSFEPAYLKLTDEESKGYFVDPRPIYGVFNNSIYASHHTQSTRWPSLPDGGIGGGLDDRFDFILISPSLQGNNRVRYIEGSYTVFGNDGEHFDRSINDAGNAAVGQEIADALYYGSDHLPVYADFDFGTFSNLSDEPLISDKTELYQNYPNPFNPSTTINYRISKAGYVKIKLLNVLGQEVKTLVNEYKQAGMHNYNLRMENGELPSGIYFYSLSSEKNYFVKKMIYLK